jgi:short-subunit dehydrogenase|tara:strand:+ start:76 stop:879 length:804 start_codon:yes stop_codon:yes gene_type:complete
MSKVVLITGGSSGLGKSIGEFLIEKKFKVYGTSRYPEKYPDSKFPILKLDINQPDSICACVTELISKTNRIDILINNAGVGITGPIEEIPINEMKRNFDTNFFGPVQMINTVLPYMRKQNTGLILNVTSIAGYMGLPFRGIYSAGKGALELITESYRMELKDFNIKMSNIAPGDFDTNIAAGRYQAPELENSAYKTSYGNAIKLMNSHLDSGEAPLLMAKAVYKVITSKNPKIHYKVGAVFQKFSVVLKRILPDHLFERLLMLFYKI